MRKKRFDVALYREGARQLRIGGVVLLVVSLVLSVLPPVLGWLSVQNGRTQSHNNQLPFSVSANMLAPVFIPLMFLVPVILTLLLFSAFHTRKGSDFYHAIANTRGSIFISFGAAVLSWTAGITILSVLLPTLLYAALGAVLIPVYIPCVLFTYLAGGTLVTAVMLLAMALTGTILVNLILGALILFLPRVVMTLFTYSVTSSLHILEASSLGLIGNVGSNIPFQFLYVLLFAFTRSSDSGAANTSNIMLSGSAIAYTLVLAAIYFVLGWFAFRCRQSETAGVSAPNRLFQHIYRCAFTLPIAVFIPFCILTVPSEDSSKITLVIILAVIALIAYFLFELISTKKLKNLLTAVPVLLVVVAIDAIFGFGALGVRNSVLQTHAPVKDIQSVTIRWDHTASYDDGMTVYYHENDRNVQQYNDILAQNDSFSQNAVKKRVSSDLDNTIKVVQSNLSRPTGNQLAYTLYYTATIHMKDGRVLVRHLGASITSTSNDNAQTQWQQLQAAMMENADYKAHSTVLPMADEINAVSLYDSNDSTSNFSNHAQTQKIWSTYRAEFAQMNDMEKTSVLMHDQMNSALDGNYEEFIRVTGTYGTQYFYGLYALSTRTPQTFTLYIQDVNTPARINMAKTIIKNPSNASTPYEITIYTPQDGKIHFASTSDTDMRTIMQSNLGQSVDISQPFAKVHFYSSTGPDFIYFPLSSDNLKTLRADGLLH